MIESKKFTNPFPGLRPFETDEYRLFFGREGQSDALITRLQRARFLAVVGTSGSGKSSLVRAGLLPALRGGMMAGAGSGWHICIMRPGSDPFGNLAHSLAEKDVLSGAGGGLPPAEAEAVIEATLRGGSLGLVDAARHARLAEGEKLLVLVDQFEELFRFRAARTATSTGDDASAFVKVLLEAAQQHELSLYVVLTMRSDFLGDCAQFQGLPEAINEGQYLIPRMTRDERRMAITGPVGVTRGKMSEPLINRLLNDVGDNPDQLPILQHALMRTWDYWAAHRRNGEPIGLEHYEAIGTMAEALSLHADEAWGELPDDRSRHVAEKLFKALTEKGADNREIRRPAQLSEISAAAEATEGEVVAIIDVFRREGRSFLMPPAEVKLSSDTVIDISHESLIRNWDRLQKWVDEEAQSARIYRRLAEAAVLHREGQEGLLQDPALQIGLDWREQQRPNAAWANRYHSEFATAIAFLDASREQRDAELAEIERQRQEEIERDRRELEMTRDFAEKQARAVRRLRWLTAGMAVMFVLALFVAGLAWHERAKADRLKITAQKAQASAVQSAKEARDAQAQAEESARVAKQEKDKAEEYARVAKREKDNAEKSARVAQKAQASAEDSKKELEASNARLTDEKKKTDAALKTANENLSRFNLSLNRSTYNGLGAAAFQREDYSKALVLFSQAFDTLKSEQARPANDDDEKNILRFARVSLLSNLGATQRELGESDNRKLDEAVASYDCARTTLVPEGAKADEACRVAEERARKQAEEEAARPQAEAARQLENFNWTLFDILYGAGHAYRDRANSAREKFNRNLALERAGNLGKESNSQSGLPPEAIMGFKKAEDYFKQALEIQERLLKGTDPGRLASSYEELGGGYLDNGLFEAAEVNFKRAVELRHLNKESSTLDSNERAALAASLRKLGELYQGQEGGYDKAVAVFNEMITLQEDISVDDLAQQGQAIANSYIDLGQIHAARGKSVKADDAFRIANVLQRTALMLRRRVKVQRGGPQERAIVKELDTDLDELGDAYIKLGKFDDAEVIYVTALSQRYVEGSDLEKSYDKLTKLYRKYKKDPAKAEEYNQLLLKFYENNPGRRAEYADALVQLAALYAADPNKSSDAEKDYNSALKIYQDQHDWWNENLILYRLSKLYETPNGVPKREQALRDRVDTLNRYFNQLANPSGPQPKDPVTLVSEYLYAINALAYFYHKNNNPEAEAAAYQRVATVEAARYITNNIYNEKVLDFYAATLEDYQKRLKGTQTEASVAEKASAVRVKLRQSNQIREQQEKQISPPLVTPP